jgi:N-hydroxyarylamine O-acetyltransferase
VNNGRGGYCYEHNLLLLDVLLALGFRAVGLAARVHRSRPPGVVPPRSHMLLRVDLGEDALVVDVGFGTALTAPLALEAGREQKTPHEDFCFVPVNGEFDLQVKFGDVWTDLYRLSLQEQLPIDYEAINWYTSTHPDSLFVRNVIAARPGPRCRHTLFNDKFTTRHFDGRVERRILNGVKDFGEVLPSCFGSRCPTPLRLKRLRHSPRSAPLRPIFSSEVVNRSRRMNSEFTRASALFTSSEFLRR